MRTPLWAVLSPLTVLLGGCGPEAPPPAAGDREAAVVSMIEEGWNRGNVETFSTTIADSVRFHYTSEAPRRMSREAMADVVLRWREAFPDLRLDIEELVAEDDLVAVRLTLSGTHRGEWAGVAPTGRHVEMALMMFFRFEDGRMVELWEVDDQLGFRRQLGMSP